jgi:hypothetical protein
MTARQGDEGGITVRLFALLLQEHPLQCKEKAAYPKKYHKQSLRVAVYLEEATPAPVRFPFAAVDASCPFMQVARRAWRSLLQLRLAARKRDA